DPFTQGDRLPGSVSEGLGLGLTLVRGLVELHGGRVSASSAGPGRGSTFEVRLPLLKVANGSRKEGPRQPDLPPPHPCARPLKVLVVDDNVDAAQSLALLLRARGHEVEVAHDGASTLALAAAQRPDVIFLDIGLPGGLDGYEVARRLRAG